MTEFKVNKELSADIATLQLVAQTLKMELTLDAFHIYDDLQTLPTAKKFMEQHAAIKNLLQLYADLVIKDANDLYTMIEGVQRMDATIGIIHDLDKGVLWEN